MSKELESYLDIKRPSIFRFNSWHRKGFSERCWPYRVYSGSEEQIKDLSKPDFKRWFTQTDGREKHLVNRVGRISS